MKRLTLTILAVGALAAAAYFLTRSEPKPGEPATAVTDAGTGSSGTARATATVSTAASNPAPRRIAQHPAEAPSAARLAYDEAIETIVSPVSTHMQKYEAWQKLKESGQLDRAITEFEERVAGDPLHADNFVALGLVYVTKTAMLTNIPEQGILAMKADQAFASALNLDSANWDARFTKSVLMSYWPAQLNKGQEVIDNFTQLIAQQETQAPEPQFAQTYLWLGDQYQKAGKSDSATQTWQRGAALFPNDSGLAKRLAQSAPQ